MAASACSGLSGRLQDLGNLGETDTVTSICPLQTVILGNLYLCVTLSGNYLVEEVEAFMTF